MECVTVLVDKLYRGGKIKDKCENAGFYERLILIEQQFKGAAVLLHKMEYLPAGIRNLWANERLLNVVEQLIGPDIAGIVESQGSILYSSTHLTHSLTSRLQACIAV